MAHIRQQIRDAAETALAGGTVPASRIYKQRVHPVKDGELPMWRIFTPSESASPQEMGSPREVQRLVRLVLEVHTSGPNAENTADDLAAEAEAALAADLTLGGVAQDLRLSTTDIEVSGEGRKALALASLVFEVEALTTDQDPQTAL